jgi:hypothetical protein
MPNRLDAATSPYLRQHADNPVDWFPWGEEAFAKARAEQKPIFLSIGYSTCHWCHVMAHESFESVEVAEVLNRGFLPVKVDREERPDIDRVYMAYVQATTGHGGWPMSVWLTPDLKPFFGGTYFPPDDRHGRAGFVSILNAVSREWTAQRDKINVEAARVLEALRQHALTGGAHEIRAEGAPVPLHEAAGEAFEQCFQYFFEAFDPKWGGFGGAPKFPRGSAVDFLFRVAALQGPTTELGQEAVKFATFTLQRMAEGGLHDHVGGGFHRYSVDEEWHVPHFEKMLYDQAQIAVNYLAARQATGRETYAWVARGIFNYVARDLTGPHGGFFSAEDADSLVAHGRPEHAEGAFYVWTPEELQASAPAAAGLLAAHFNVKSGGNVAHDPHREFTGKSVLRQTQSLALTAHALKLELPQAEEHLLAGLEQLRVVRANRPRPHLDDKVITAWNGLMISALAKAHQVLGDAGYLAAATRAAEFIERELHDARTGELYRSWRGQRGAALAFADDYAALVQGLLDLYEAGFEIRWLQWAVRLQERMDAAFWDEETGGYFNSRAGATDVIVRMKDDYDGAEPAPSSLAAMNLVRLGWMLGGKSGDYREKARRTLEAFRRQWSRVPQGLPQMLGALELDLESPRTVVLAGDPHSAGFRALAAVLHEQLGPRRALLCADGGAGQAWLARHSPYLAEMKPVDGRPTAYVCENFACRQPVGDPAALRALLAQ